MPPWELARMPVAWVRMAEAAQSAEAHAEAIHQKRQNNPVGG